jgi:hypothetical protein
MAAPLTPWQSWYRVSTYYHVLLHRLIKSRKSAVAFEFASRQQTSYSVFWFNAENSHYLQEWFDRASLCIAPQEFNAFSRNHHRAVIEWLSDPANGRWILIFDNAKSELDYGLILPSSVSWGKVLFTSRSREIQTQNRGGADTRIRTVPALSADKARNLFTSRYEKLRGPLSQEQKSRAANLISEIQDNAFAIVLASSYFGGMLITYQSVLEDSPPTPKEVEHYLWPLACLIIDDLSENAKIFMDWACLLSLDAVSQDLMRLCRQPGIQFLQLRSSGDITRTLELIGLVETRTSSKGPSFEIPPAIRDISRARLAANPQRTAQLVLLGLQLITHAFSNTSTSTPDHVQKHMQTTLPAFRNLCKAADNNSIPLQADFVNYVQFARVNLALKTCQEGRHECYRQFWRIWLTAHQQPLHISADPNKRCELPMTGTWNPKWLSPMLQQTADLEDDGIMSVLYTSIYDGLWDAFKNSIAIMVVGRAWHGIRDRIFDFAKRCTNTRISDDQTALMIDLIDKGGAEGVMSAARAFAYTEDFKHEIMGRIGEDIVREISNLVNCFSHERIATLSEDMLRQSVSAQLESLMSSTFLEASGAMDDVLLPVVGLITTVLEPFLDVPSINEGLTNTIHFLISTTAVGHIRDRGTQVAEGFFECLDASRVWIAEGICSSLAHALLNQTASSEEAYLLTCATLELLREGVMQTERCANKNWKVAGQRMMYWVVDAEMCGTAWGALSDVVTPYEYRNQDEWTESQIMMSAADHAWVLS